MKLFLLLILFTFLVGCNKNGGGFDSLDGKIDDGSQSTFDPILITSYTPEIDPIILTNSTSAVFGILVSGNVGTVNYDFILDNNSTTKLSSGSSAFLNVLGSSLVAGTHEISILASNGDTSAEKVFNVRKNHAPAIILSSPDLSGVTMNCGSDTKKFTSLINDLDEEDNYQITWEIDNQLVTNETPFIERTDLPSYSQLEYSPDCSLAGTHTIVFKVTDGYDTTTTSWTFIVNNPPPEPNQVQILSWIPTSTPVIMTSLSETTFGVSVAEGAGTIGYKFYLDNEQVQDSGTSFYSMSGISLMAGFHSLRVVASNGITQAEKSFNIRKNTPPSVSSYTPGLTGNTISCSGGSISLNANIGDVNGDAVSVKWKMDETLVTSSTDFVTYSSTTSNTALTYTPDCTDVGFHSFKLVLNDGHEDFDQTWTVSVNNPPTPPGEVQILTFTPTSSPTVVTAATSTTFAVSIADGAGPVTYQFKRDDVEVLQNGSDPFYIMQGSLLTAGTHSIRVRATNANSYDEKTFSVRRNNLPNYIVYSPDISGSTVSCGNSITFDATVIDLDPDTLTKSWLIDNVSATNATPGVTVTTSANTGKLVYVTDCNQTGFHTASIKTFDGYEYSDLTWTFSVTNPAQESLGTTTPSGSTVVALSTETTKSFSAVAATGIPPFTFKWTIKRSGQPDQIVKTESNVNSSSLILNTSSDLVYGDQTVEIKLTDSTSANDPLTPAERSWTVYRNQKPTITNKSPATAKRTNSNSPVTLSAIITDSSDTFTTSVTRGSSSCSPAISCGLTVTSTPSSTGTYSANFLPGTSFIGDNSFILSVTDSHGESASTQFDVNANFFNSACNDLDPGEICTVAGMPGMGDELDISLANNSTKIRISPYTMSMHNAGLSKKNMFITDYVNHVVWYWNRNTSTVQLGPFSIPSNTVKIILGVPGYNAGMIYVATPNPALLYDTTFGNFTTSKISNFFLNGPTAVTNSVSGSVTNVYIAEYGQNRIYRMQFNNSNSTMSVLPSAALSGCGPLDASVDTNANKLYISCNSSQYLRVLDLQTTAAPYAFQATSQAASTFATSLVGTPHSDGAVNSTGYTSSVASLFYDSNSGVTYFTETNTCRLRVLNPAGNSNTLNLFQGSANPITVTPGNITTISGGLNVSTWCTNARLGYFATPATTQFGALRGVVPYYLNGSLLGFFVSDYAYHRVIFINQTGQSITIGNRTVTAYNAGIVFGLNSVAGSTNNNGVTAGGKSSPLYNQLDIEVDNGVLYVADNSNNRLRSLVIDNGSSVTSNGTVATTLGYIPRFGYNESPTLQAELVQFNSPSGLKFDSGNNRILISDFNNRRIRSLNLNTGTVDTIIGNGSVANTTIQASPLSVGINTPYDLEIVKQNGVEFPIFADSPYFIKAVNIYGSSELIQGTEVEPGKMNNIAGTTSPPGVTNVTPSYSLYQWWSNPINDINTGNLFQYTNQPAVVVPINGPRGLGYDESSGNLYVSSTSDHCIHKIDNSGIITVQSGVCTQFNNQSGSFASTRYRYPADIEMDPLNPGNFFVIDQSDSNPSSLKYVNTYSGANSSRNILGQPVPGNSVGTITLSTTPNYSSAIAVNESQVCIANGNGSFYASSSVFCYSRAGSGSLSLYIGNRNNPSLGTTSFRGRPQKYNEDEGKGMGYFVDGGNIDPINNPSQLSDPQGLAFDDDGNLYISEYRGHTIRMVKRWYP